MTSPIGSKQRKAEVPGSSIAQVHSQGLLSLPNDLLSHIFIYAISNYQEWLAAMQTSKKAREIALHPQFANLMLAQDENFKVSENSMVANLQRMAPADRAQIKKFKCPPHVSSKALSEIFHLLPHLTFVAFNRDSNDTELSREYVEAIGTLFEKCVDLRLLVMDVRLSEEAQEILSQRIPPDLTHLGLSETNIRVPNLDRIVGRCQHLEELDYMNLSLDNIGLDQPSFPTLANISPRLRCLRINVFGRSDMLSPLFRRCPELETLDLTHQLYYQEQVPYFAATAWINDMPQRTALKHIRLAADTENAGAFPTIPFEAMNALISRSPELTDIELEEVSVSAFLGTLPVHRRVERIFLKNTDVNPETEQRLRILFPEVKHLQISSGFP